MKKRSYKKLLTCIVMAMMAIGLLAGCGGGIETAANGGNEAAADDTSVNTEGTAAEFDRATAQDMISPLLNTTKYDFAALNTHHFKFEDIHKAFDVACHDKADARKVMLTF